MSLCCGAAIAPAIRRAVPHEGLQAHWPKINDVTKFFWFFLFTKRTLPTRKSLNAAKPTSTPRTPRTPAPSLPPAPSRPAPLVCLGELPADLGLRGPFLFASLSPWVCPRVKRAISGLVLPRQQKGRPTGRPFLSLTPGRRDQAAITACTDFTISATESGSSNATAASTLRSSSILARFRPLMNTE